MGKDYKDTLLMPHTNFDMRANLVNKQEKFQLFWDDNNIWKKWNNNKDKLFVLHDGPPYANGSIHVGHALNKILKDIIIKSKSLDGFKVDWKIGWDTHGLPIELAIQKKGFSPIKDGKINYLNKARDFANQQVEIQKKQFKSLQLSTDFSNYYKTMDKDFEANQLDIFATMYEKKYIYQDLKPIYWSWSSLTALAESEIEYKDIVSPSAYVKFKIKNYEEEDISVLIWTTTPWTLPGNVGIAVGENISYSIVEINKEKLIIANENITLLEKELDKKIKNIKEIGTGIDLVKKNLIAINPINNKNSKIVIGHHVNTSAGTGLVHIAGGHGTDDFIVAKNNNLEIFSVVNEKGHIINSDKYNELFYLKAQKEIVNDLQANSSILFLKEFKHSYPHDWRTKKPVIFRATKQWFASVDKIKTQLLNATNKINWIPEWGQHKSEKMIIDRSDWCISRQRLWGFPIPIIYDRNNKVLNSPLYFKNLREIFLKEGSIAWFKRDVKELLPKDIKYDKTFRKETDTLDVWFDSGSSWNAVINNKKSSFPSDLILEGSDQYRGWFASSLITSYAFTKKPMTKNILAHGFVLDEKGNKMSKSIGNVIDPLKIVSRMGSDILRLWVASVEYQLDVRIGDNILKQVSETYRKLRNTIRFMLSNINDFNYSKDNIQNLEGVNKYITAKFNNLIVDIRKDYNEYNFWKIVNKINLFFINDLSSFYFDYAKDILYTTKKDDFERRSIQTVIYKILNIVLLELAPIIPTTIEEAYLEFNKKNKKKSVFLESREKMNKTKIDPIWDSFLKVRSLVNKEIEKVKNENILKKTLEADVLIKLPHDLIKLKKLNLKALLLVANLNIEITDKEIEVVVNKFNGSKCERCWKYFKDLEEGDICADCQKTIS